MRLHGELRSNRLTAAPASTQLPRPSILAENFQPWPYRCCAGTLTGFRLGPDRFVAEYPADERYEVVEITGELCEVGACLAERLFGFGFLGW